MALSAAERMRRYRQRVRSNPDQYKTYLDKEHKRWKKRREENVLPPLVNDLSERSQRVKRKEWRKKQKQRRTEIKKRDEIIRNHLITPPTSPMSPRAAENSDESTSRRGRTKVRRDRAKAYKKIQKLQDELFKKTKEADKHRKRYDRLKNKLKNKGKAKGKPTDVQFPILRKSKLRGKLRQQLILHCVVAQQLRRKMKETKSLELKQVISSVVTAKLLKKYKVMNLANELLGISQKRLRYNSINSRGNQIRRKTYRNAVSSAVRERVVKFFEEDINSRLLPGKRDTITRNKVKKQKRILTDSVKNLHKKFLKEHEDVRKISYSMFCKLRPFWVCDPTCASRDTCTCKLHANVDFMFFRLKQHSVLIASTLKEACESLCCETITKECMYRECDMCKEKSLMTHVYEEGMQVWVHSWINRHETRIIQKPNKEAETINVQVTVKDKIYCTLETLVADTNKILKEKYCRHVYNITHQYTELKRLKENISENESIIHIDFSENYACKLSTEVQGMHFGASRNQVSLHTGVMYLKGTPPDSFCTMSENTRHDPAAIWAHLDPILQSLKQENPSVDTVHFVSDGPTTQYRSRKNFYLLQAKSQKYQFKTVTWNFSEAGHGKGAPDGVGGVIKRTADHLVGYGRDICDAENMYEAIKSENLSVRIYKIHPEAIYDIDKELSNVEIESVPGTMLLHQVICKDNDPKVHVKSLSCFCTKHGICTCFSNKCVMLTKPHKRLANDVTRSVLPDNVAQFALPDNIAKSTLPDPDNIAQSAFPDNIAQFALPDNIAQSALPDPDNIAQSALPDNTYSPSVDMIGQWVVVDYDDLPYPGIVQDVDHSSFEVKVMHKIGINRYFWPAMHDCIWYKFDKITTTFQGMIPVTNRHMKMPLSLWEAVCTKFDL